MTYRPRGVFARALYDKVNNDRYLEGYDMRLWYKLPNELPEKYQSKFVQLEEPDDTTRRWLDEAKVLSANLWLQIWHIIARLFLATFMTQTDVNGLLKRGSMFILSENHFKDLLVAGGFSPSSFENDSMIDILDIGAGDGEVTSRLAKSVIHMGSNIMLKVYATEYSWTMRDRLQKKKFTVIDRLQNVSNVHLISCLNVLDRCADPHQIMTDIYNALHPNGRAIVALVLPYSHYVESNSSHLPIKPLLPHWPQQSRSFEDEATVFFEQLELMGFNIEAWTKAPYLCEGDLRQSFYWLIDVVVVLSKKTGFI
ncbi:Protein-L-histidine N-pros-methyltransferase [Pseudolycoriella hygida]|uniref:Protein-L-histidine N-pros-methyltransferase n=1 Tax=Pseudolycoriella hygida TaxID=35572 RepID=A0A9Q0N843_9DIPT|nr:Protein-L-histidine N-pros-methyltransferase [Pseudolycoriella hygida]